jgi:ribonucleotide reductase alpha subunit
MIVFFSNFNWLKTYIYPIIHILVIMVFVHWQEFVVGDTNRDISEFKSYYDSISKMLLKKKEIETPVNVDSFVSVKEVFKTFKEINQLDLVKQAGLRQTYVDQAVSLNLAFPTEATPKFINQVHMEAYKRGVKTLYYMRTESVLRGDIANKALDENCLSCDG